MKIAKQAQVDRALRSVIRHVRVVTKAVNQQAVKSLGRGRYGEAEILVHAGRSISEFVARVEDLRQQWKELASSSGTSGEAGEKGGSTPLWQYYRPILRALVVLDGTAARAELERQLAPTLTGWLKSADLAPGPRGIARWKGMLRRARRPMIKEGFIEAEGGGRWRLTAKGREVAQEAPVSAKPR